MRVHGIPDRVLRSKVDNRIANARVRKLLYTMVACVTPGTLDPDVRQSA